MEHYSEKGKRREEHQLLTSPGKKRGRAAMEGREMVVDENVGLFIRFILSCNM